MLKLHEISHIYGTVYSVQCTVYRMQCTQNLEVFSDQALLKLEKDCIINLGTNWPQHQESAFYEHEEKLGILVSGPFVLRTLALYV